MPSSAGLLLLLLAVLSAVAFTRAQHPLSCGENGDNTERYYKTADGDTCPTTPNQTNSCYYPITPLQTEFPTTLRLVGPDAENPLFASPVSRLQFDGTVDRIYLAFDMPVKYYNHTLLFPDEVTANGGCGTWELTTSASYAGAVDYPLVNTDDLGNCYFTYEYSQVWTAAYNKDTPLCGFVRTEANKVVSLELDFSIFVDEDLVPLRDSVPHRNVTFAHPVQVDFPLTVTANTENITVFGPYNTIPAITAQEVFVDEASGDVTLTITLATEIQAPFELWGIEETLTPGIASLITVLNATQEADDLIRDANCADDTVPCGNEWTIQYLSQDSTPPCTFNGDYAVTFRVRCAIEAAGEGDCPSEETDRVRIDFTLASSDHCAQLIDSIEVTSSLRVFDSDARDTVKDDFLSTQIAYFDAPTKATQVALLDTEFHSVILDRPVKSDFALHDKTNSPVIASSSVGNTPTLFGDYNFGHVRGGPAIAGAFSTPEFQFLVDTDLLGNGNDTEEFITIRAVIDLTYQNDASKRTSESAAAGFVSQAVRYGRTYVSQSVTLGEATPSGGNPGNGGSTTSSSSAVFGINATVAYGALLGIAVVIIGTIFAVTRRKRSSSDMKMERVQSSADVTTDAAQV